MKKYILLFLIIPFLFTFCLFNSSNNEELDGDVYIFLTKLNDTIDNTLYLYLRTSADLVNYTPNIILNDSSLEPTNQEYFEDDNFKNRQYWYYLKSEKEVMNFDFTLKLGAISLKRTGTFPELKDSVYNLLSTQVSDTTIKISWESSAKMFGVYFNSYYNEESSMLEDYYVNNNEKLLNIRHKKQKFNEGEFIKFDVCVQPIGDSKQFELISEIPIQFKSSYELVEKKCLQVEFQ